jgi:hypothetical protein
VFNRSAPSFAKEPPAMPANITHQNGATEKRWAPIMVFSGISGLGRTTIYQLLAAKILRGKKVYGRTLIDVPHGLSAIEAMPDASITLPNSRRGARERAPAAEASKEA